MPQNRVRAALELLNPSERLLFQRMLPVDQRHALAVYGAARGAAPNDPALWKAALLHDAGKGRPTLPMRVALTLLSSWAPWLLIRWAATQPRTSLRRRLARLAAHTEASARFAELAGSDPDVIEILRAYGHREHPHGRLLAELDATR